MWFCMNLVCGPEGRASTVPARTRRLSARDDRELAKGPARPATALGVDRALNGTDACTSRETPLRILTGTPVPADQVRNGPRTGVTDEGGVDPWRYWVADGPMASLYRAYVPEAASKLTRLWETRNVARAA